ncbi:MAG: peptidoglycan bridge formation glycyltransferase FemA/FemB family protein [Candidatus Dojkabacteria bacterium]|nr:MAG: peptidoglycan bridge formation glycyltransferase FemA/FemB family protein [Candidatus Dojkabacteria bacterium]
MKELVFKQIEDKNLWNTFVDNSPWGDILQYWQWGEVKKTEGWEPLRYAIFEADKIILAAQCLIKEAGLLGKYLYIAHGPVFQSVDDLQKALPFFVEHLSRVAKRLSCFTIEIEPKLGYLIDTDKLSKNIEPFVDEKAIQIFYDAGFVYTGRNMQPKYKLLYDLEKTEQELLSQMKKNTRYNINYAQKKGVVINRYLPNSNVISKKLNEFYGLLKEMQARAAGYPIRPFSTFAALVAEFKETNAIEIFEAEYEKEVIVMNISERTKHWASSFYAGSNRKHANVKASYLLRWSSVMAAKDSGCKVYDFWGIIPGSKQHQGYSDNKLSFGGARIDHIGILALPVNQIRFLIWTKILPIRNLLYSLFRKSK